MGQEHVFVVPKVTHDPPFLQGHRNSDMKKKEPRKNNIINIQTNKLIFKKNEKRNGVCMHPAIRSLVCS